MSIKEQDDRFGQSIIVKQFTRFFLVGAFGFLVDTSVLYFCLLGLGLDVYSGRIFSYLSAATFTWYFNRKYTFSSCDTSAPFKQWVKFLVTNGIGGVVNYSVYAFVVTFWVELKLAPLLGVSLGSIVGLVFNFTLSRLIVFTQIEKS